MPKITRRTFNRLALSMAALPSPLLTLPEAPGPRPDWPGYAEAMVIDALASPGPFNVPGRMDAPLTAEMLANAKASGITAVNVTVNGGSSGYEAFYRTVKGLAYWEREVDAHPDVFMKVTSVETLREAKRSGRLGLIFGFQDTVMLEQDPERLPLFHDFGVRIIQLTYNLRNVVGDGCLEPANAGLSKFGHRVVARMNELGLLIDASHCGTRTTDEAIDASEEPIAITHSGCKSVFDHPRSKSDGTLRKLADRGGVLGIYMMPFLNAQGPPTADHLMQHIEHALQVCGEDHVGIGSDLSTTPYVADAAYRQMLVTFAEERQRLGIAAPRENELLFIPDLNVPRRLERIADLLLERGHPERRVEKIIGGNWLRLFEEVWS